MPRTFIESCRRVIFKAGPPRLQSLVQVSFSVNSHGTEEPGAAVWVTCVPPVLHLKCEISLELPTKGTSIGIAKQRTKTQPNASQEVVLRSTSKRLEVVVGDESKEEMNNVSDLILI